MLTQSSAGWLSRKACCRELIMFSQRQVTSTGRPYLDAALGSTFTNLFTQQRVSEWIEGVSHLSTFAETASCVLCCFYSCTVIFPSGTTIFVPPQIFPTCFLLLSLLFVATFCTTYDFSKELLQGLISLIFHQNPVHIVHQQNETYRHLSSQSARERSLAD